MNNCIFCDIISDKIIEEKILETDNLIAIDDINPKSSVHVLIMTRRHIERPEELNTKELKELFALAKNVAEKKLINKDGYKLLFNVGKKAGQEIEHVHMHLIGGVETL